MARRRYRYYDDYFRYPKSTPREAKGGIKAQSRRGEFGSSWWAKRWISVLERFDLGARLSRGRSYARKGQVLSIDIDKGTVLARVQGSRSKPYSVRIGVKTLTDDDWSRLAQHFAGQAIFAAKLLSGEMPNDIEDAFAAAGLSLFPARHDDLETDCSCPDWSNPCKHIAAVYYLLGEEFDRDPFLMFRLRGMEREPFIALISAAMGTVPDTETRGAAENAPLATDPEPLPCEAAAFWGQAPPEDSLKIELSAPSAESALPRLLGSVPFWRSTIPFNEAMDRIYLAAAQHGIACIVGARESNLPPTGTGHAANPAGPPAG